MEWSLISIANMISSGSTIHMFLHLAAPLNAHELIQRVSRSGWFKICRQHQGFLSSVILHASIKSSPSAILKWDSGCTIFMTKIDHLSIENAYMDIVELSDLSVFAEALLAHIRARFLATLRISQIHARWVKYIFAHVIPKSHNWRIRRIAWDRQFPSN